MFYTENGKAVYAPSKTLRDIRLKIGLVFQNFNLFPHFSVNQNIMEAPLHVLKQPKAEAKANCEELLKKWDSKLKASLIHASFQAVSSSEYLSQEHWL